MGEGLWYNELPTCPTPEVAAAQLWVGPRLSTPVRMVELCTPFALPGLILVGVGRVESGAVVPGWQAGFWDALFYSDPDWPAPGAAWNWGKVSSNVTHQHLRGMERRRRARGWGLGGARRVTGEGDGHGLGLWQRMHMCGPMCLHMHVILCVMVGN